MSRREPRPMAPALSAFAAHVAPATLLARVQGAWEPVAGATLASEAAPVAERDGEVRIACRSATWAQELAHMEPDLRGRLNEALGPTSAGPVRALRFRYERPR